MAVGGVVVYVWHPLRGCVGDSVCVEGGELIPYCYGGVTTMGGTMVTMVMGMYNKNSHRGRGQGLWGKGNRSDMDIRIYTDKYLLIDNAR